MQTTKSAEQRADRPRKCPCVNADGKFSLVQAGVTPLPWGQLSILFALLTGSAASITFYQPFLKDMATSFGYKEVDAGFYVGFISSAFHLGRIISSYAWGYISDRFGRRPTLLASMLCVSASTLAFGFSRSFGFASAVGVFSGLTNGLAVAGKAHIYEVSDSSNQSYGIAMLSLSWGLGSLVGPVLGGFLSKYKAVPDFPYLLPSIALTAFLTAILLASFWLLKEPRRGGVPTLEVDTEGPEDATPLNGHHVGEEAGRQGRRGSAQGDGPTTESELFRSLPNVIGGVRDRIEFDNCNRRLRHASLSRSVALLAAVSADNCLSALPCPSSAVQSGEEARKKNESFATRLRRSNIGRIMLNPECVKVTVLFLLQSMCGLYLKTLAIVWIPTSTDLGGLGFTAQDLAALLGSSAVWVMILEPMVFPLLERRLGATRMLVHNLMLTLICGTTLPLVHYAVQKPTLVWICCVVLLGLLNQAFNTSFSCVSLLVNNSVPADLVGSMNGVSMALCSVGRLLGPLISGSIFAASIDSGRDYPLDFNLPFQLGGLMLILVAALGSQQSARLDRKLEDR